MSKDKSTAKRLYSIRGAASKRKLKQAKARSGERSKPGHKWVAFCPFCERPEPTGIGPDTVEAECKKGHIFPVGGRCTWQQSIADA